MAMIVVCKNLPAAAMAIYPFILVKHATYKSDSILINHERIHFQQQLELLILPFYFLYLLNYVVNIFKYKSHHLAYFNIAFEKEAYANEHDSGYLYKRKRFAWYKWLRA